MREAFLNERIGLRDEYVPGDLQTDVCRPVDLAARLATIRAFVIGTSLFPSGDYAALAGRAFDELDGLLFDQSLGFYVNAPNALSPHYSPLELGLATSALESLARVSTPARAALVRDRLLSFFHGVADTLGLQLEAFTGLAEPRVEHFAPVFAHEVVLDREGGKAEGRAPAVGDLVRYTLDLANPTSKAFTALVLEDTLPAGLAYVASTPTATVDGSTVRFSTSRLCPGEERAWSVVARVETEGVDPLANCARVTYTDPATGKREVKEACATKPTGRPARSRGAERPPSRQGRDAALAVTVILASIGLCIPGASGVRRRIALGRAGGRSREDSDHPSARRRRGAPGSHPR